MAPMPPAVLTDANLMQEYIQRERRVELFYENWRYQDRAVRKGEGQQNSYKWATPKNQVTTADSVYIKDNAVTFYHHNPEKTVFDVAVSQQGLEGVKSRMMNPLENLISGGRMLKANVVHTA